MCFFVQRSFPFIYYSAEKSFLAPHYWQSQPGLCQLQNFAPSSALPASPLSPCACCPSCCFCDRPCYLLVSFPGPWKQCDSLPEGWHLERLLSSLQGDAGPVCSAHAAQQPPEAAVLWWIRHRSVGMGKEEEDEREGGVCSPWGHFMLWSHLPEWGAAEGRKLL